MMLQQIVYTPIIKQNYIIKYDSWLQGSTTYEHMWIKFILARSEIILHKNVNMPAVQNKEKNTFNDKFDSQGKQYYPRVF